MRTRSVVPLLAMTVVVLSGCSTSAAHAKAATYPTLDDLKSAYIASGSTCPTWQEDDDIQAAAQSGTCGNGATLSIGANWLVSGPNVRDLQPKLGGQLAVINPAASN